MNKAALMAAAAPRVVPKTTRTFATATKEDDDNYVPLGVAGLVAITEKLLATNRGIIPTDDRDSLEFKTILTPDKLAAERIALDAGKIRLNTLRRAARNRTLQGVNPGHFSSYTRGLLESNPLSMPLEEINPMHIEEQSRRVTAMGPGGLGSDDAITEDSQSISASQFGYFSPIEGPECHNGVTEVYTARGWVRWDAVQDDDVFACRVAGALAWHKASRVIRQHYKGEMLAAETSTFKMCVTPGHTVLHTRDMTSGVYRLEPASEVFGKMVSIPVTHSPYAGSDASDKFQLPAVEKTNNNQREFGEFDMGDWCSFMGWWLSEGHVGEQQRKSSGGSTYSYMVLGISQDKVEHPENHAEIAALLRRMGLRDKERGDEVSMFTVGRKQLSAYFRPWMKDGCHNKWIPDELFEVKVEYRQKLLDALLKGDGRVNAKRISYCTVSSRLADCVERLAIGLGHAAYIRQEKDKRPHVKTINYVVSITRAKHRTIRSGSYITPTNGKAYGDNWSKQQYDGMVYCATVPGGLLLVRGKEGTAGYWSGNSGRAGIDKRLATGVHYGSDGQLYQVMFNRRTGKKEWVSHNKAAQSIIKIPD